MHHPISYQGLEILTRNAPAHASCTTPPPRLAMICTCGSACRLFRVKSPTFCSCPSARRLQAIRALMVIRYSGCGRDNAVVSLRRQIRRGFIVVEIIHLRQVNIPRSCRSIFQTSRHHIVAAWSRRGSIHVGCDAEVGSRLWSHCHSSGLRYGNMAWSNEWDKIWR